MNLKFQPGEKAVFDPPAPQNLFEYQIMNDPRLPVRPGDKVTVGGVVPLPVLIAVGLLEGRQPYPQPYYFIGSEKLMLAESCLRKIDGDDLDDSDADKTDKDKPADPLPSSWDDVQRVTGWTPPVDKPEKVH